MTAQIATIPGLFYELAFNASPNSGSALVWTDLTHRTGFAWSTTRGRQYELDVNQAGIWRTSLDDRDGALDPGNSASPFSPGVVPYRGARIRAFPNATANLLTADRATSGQGTPFAPGAIPAAMQVTADLGTPVLVASATAFEGTQVYQTPISGGASTGQSLLTLQQQPVRTPGVGPTDTYTWSIYVRSVTTGANPQVGALIRWYGVTGALVSTTAGTAQTLTGSASAAWTRVAASGQVPAGAVSADLAVLLTGSAPGSAWSFQGDGAQIELAAAASTWTNPGPVYYLYSGLAERYPQSWRMSGTYGSTDLVAVDALAGIAQFTLLAPFLNEVLAMGPDFFYTLSDPAGSASCADLAAKRVAAPIESSPFGAGSLVLGSSITATSQPSGLFAGSNGPVATFNNNPAAAPSQLAQTFISLHKTAVLPGPPRSGPWTRMIAFRAPAIPASGTFPTLWNANTPSYGSDLSLFQIYIDPTTGFLVAQISGAAGTGPVVTSAGSVCDGNWHQVALAYTPGGFVDVFLDGARIYHDNNSGTGYATPTSIITDVIGCSITPGASNYTLGFVGDAAHAAQFPFALSTAQALTLYNSWRSASSGESTGTRAARVLTWIGYKGATSIDAGVTQQMGPATDLTGATALDALNAIALTEAGNLYVDASGTLTFKQRSARYNQANPVFVFGENAGSGEWPYESFTPEFDTQHVFNDIQVTQYSTSQVATAIDLASQTSNFPRILQRTINVLNYSEAADAASYLLQQYKSARKRVADLTLHASAIPGLFAVLLQIDIGTRIRVMRRTQSAPTQQIDCFVESVNWDFDPTSGEANCHLQCSPADLAAYWVLAAMHTTLHAQANSGAGSITINALADSALNPLAASMPQTQQLTLEPGTARAETVTVVPPLPSTTPGYTTATLNVTPTLAFTHNANTTVCEPLPSGVTDPTTYDTLSVLGALSTSFASAASSGTNTITVNASADGKTNALASDLSTGDLLWLSPGTPQFEGYNLLTPNQSTAGEGVLPLAAGTSGATVGITSDQGTLTVAASATAFQGANVWAVGVAANASTPSGLLYLVKAPASAGATMTASAYVRSATSSRNPQCNLYIKFLDIAGNQLLQSNSSTVTLTGSPTAAWTRLAATGTAPTGTVWAQIGVVLTSAPSGSWTFQADGLQLEVAGSASTYQTCPQVLSVATAYPGYSTCVVTLGQNLTQNHAANDIVCDPLPPGDTSPAQIAATSRIAY